MEGPHATTHTSHSTQWESVPRLRARPPLPAQASFPSLLCPDALPGGACAEARALPLRSSPPFLPAPPSFLSRVSLPRAAGSKLLSRVLWTRPLPPPLPPLGSPAGGDEAAAAAAPAALRVAAVGAAGTPVLRRGGGGRGGAASAAAAGFPSSLA